MTPALRTILMSGRPNPYGISRSLVSGIGRATLVASAQDGHTSFNWRKYYRTPVDVDANNARLEFLIGLNTTAEAAMAFSQNIMMGMEYPVGATGVRQHWAGAAAIADSGIYVADELYTIPRNTRFGVKYYQDQNSLGANPGLLYMQGSGAGGMTASGEGFISNSGTDFSVLSTFTSPTGYSLGGLGVLGLTQKGYSGKPSLALVGVSYDGGQGDGNGISNGGTNLIGWFERAVSNTYAAINLGISSDTLQNFIAHDTRRIAFITQSISTVIDNYGTNDLAGGRTLAQLQADKISLWSVLKAAKKRVIACKMIPRTNSSNVASGAFASGAARSQLNSWYDTMLASGAIDGIWDLASAVEDQGNLGQWLPPIATYSADGIHPTSAAHALIAAAANFSLVR